MKNTGYLILLLLLSNCIGQDVFDDMAMPAQVKVTPESGVLRLGETLQFTATYLNEFGQASDAAITWTSSDPTIISIDANGLASALATGQVNVSAAAPDAQSNPILVTVVENDNSVATVEITSSQGTFAVGASAVFQARALNISGIEIPGVTFDWSSDNTNVATVSNTGEVTGVATGTASIIAQADGISSAPKQVSVGNSVRTGDFESPGGYEAKGVATLSVDPSDQLILELSSDFETSFALGTFIYLANSTSGGAVRSDGVELGEITENGGQKFNVTLIDSNVQLNTYRYVVILCKPASITFGFADLDK